MKKKHLLFMIVAIGIIVLTYFLTPTGTDKTVIGNLDFWDAIYISVINFGLIILFVILSFTGLSFFLILSSIISMGAAGSLSGLDPLVYYSSSFIHGIGEILVLSIVFWFSVDHIKFLYKTIRTETDLSIVKKFYMNRGKHVIGVLLILSFINGFTEVYISNTLVNLLA